MLSVGLVQPVAQAGGDQVPVAVGQAQREHRRARDVEDSIGERHAAWQRGARALGRDRLGRDDDHRLESHRRLEAMRPRPVADHEPALQGGSDIVGMALELGGVRADIGVELEQVVGRQQPGERRRRA